MALPRSSALKFRLIFHFLRAIIKEKISKEWSKRESVLELLEELGEIPEDIKSFVMSEVREYSLKSMLKAASTSASIEEFKEKISML